MSDLPQGANAPVPPGTLTVAFGWTAGSAAAVEADASAYLLTAAGKVRNDADMVFYNQPAGGNGAVRFAAELGTRGGFEIDPARLPADVERVCFCVTIHEAQARGQTLALLGGAEISVSGASGAALRYRPALERAAETAMTFGELYRRQGAWKFRAVGQGFAGGLAPLARSFGIDVARGRRRGTRASAPASSATTAAHPAQQGHARQAGAGGQPAEARRELWRDRRQPQLVAWAVQILQRRERHRPGSRLPLRACQWPHRSGAGARERVRRL
jgi:tellurite resistance protein TerA